MALIGHMGNLGQLRRIMIAGLILGLGAMPGSVFAGHGQAPGSSKGIHLFQDVTLNGCPQRILVQSDDVEANPLLLFLHGG
ncbi:MAG: hypothetical protein ABSA30_05765, partial [Candidatus Aminicenantales bacterium]